MLLSDLLTAYASHRDLEPTTVVTYRRAVNLLEQVDCKYTEQLSCEAVYAVLAKLRELGRSKSTFKGVQTTIRVLWRWAYRKKLAPDGYDQLDPIRVEWKNPDSWSDQEVMALLDGADYLGSQRGQICGVDARGWWRSLLLVNLDTGFRLRALLSIPWSDLRGDAIRASAYQQKSKRDEIRRIQADTMEALESIREPRRELIFPWQAETIRDIWRDADLILAAARLPLGSRNKFQKLRRTSATKIACADGMDAASKFLGHSSVQLTQTHYVDRWKYTEGTDYREALSRGA